VYEDYGFAAKKDNRSTTNGKRRVKIRGKRVTRAGKGCERDYFTEMEVWTGMRAEEAQTKNGRGRSKITRTFGGRRVDTRS